MSGAKVHALSISPQCLRERLGPCQKGSEVSLTDSSRNQGLELGSTHCFTLSNWVLLVRTDGMLCLRPPSYPILPGSSPPSRLHGDYQRRKQPKNEWGRAERLWTEDCCFKRGLWETVPLPAQNNDHWPLECTLHVSPVPSTYLANSRCSINVCRVNMGLSGEAVRANGPLISLGIAILSAQDSAEFALGSPQIGEAFPK